jgi:hypothetical protein
LEWHQFTELLELAGGEIDRAAMRGIEFFVETTWQTANKVNNILANI